MITYDRPFSGLLSSDAKLTRGEVSGLMQNVNFAAKADRAVAFLRVAGVRPGGR